LAVGFGFSKEGCPISIAESEGDLSNLWTDWEEIPSDISNGQLRFGDVELYQVGAVGEEGESVNGDPVTAVEVARAEERVVQVLLKESDQLRGRFTQRRVSVFKVEAP